MSFVGQLRRLGITSDSKNVNIFQGDIYARNLSAPPGNTYYVDVSKGVSGNGRSWSGAYKTLAEAIAVARARVDWAATPWGKRDIIRIAPGSYVENLTTLAHGVTFIGEGNGDLRDAQNGVKIIPATGVPVDVGGIINSTFINICFETSGANKCFDGGITNNCIFYRCRFQGAAETATAAKLFESVDATYLRFIECEFSCGDVGFDILGTGGDPYSKIAHCLFKDCLFDQIDTAAIRTTSGMVGVSNFVIGCKIIGGGITCAIGIDDNAGKLDCLDCNVIATDGFQGCRSVSGCYENGVLVTS